MKLNVYIPIVKQISGLARLQFTRHPYTHWSLCFLGDPQLDLDIETIFQGRQMQSNVTSLISNQIRKAIRRKHTLPNYKIRYKPFFHKTDDEIDVSDLEPPNGGLEVNLSELSRVYLPAGLKQVFATLTLAPIPWVLARQHDDKHLIVSLDLEIRKAKNQQIGIVFKQLDTCVLVEAIIPNTPATKAKLRPGDILVTIQGKSVTHINHISKIIKSLNRTVLTLRIERMIVGSIRNDQVLEDYDVYEDFNECNISFSKNSESVQIGSKVVRKNSADRQASSDSSRSNTPTKSNSSIRQEDTSNLLYRSPKSRSLSRCNSEIKTITPSVPVDETTTRKSLRINEEFDCFQQHSTIECCASSLIRMDDLAHFTLTESDVGSWINVNVFGRGSGNNDVELLGYVNLPVANVLAECAESNLGAFVKKYQLIPPSVPYLLVIDIPTSFIEIFY